MNEEVSQEPVFGSPPESADFAFDFLKHLAALALVSIGGILGILQGDSVSIPNDAVKISLGAIGFSVLAALFTNASLIEAKLADKPGKMTNRRLRISMWIALASFLFGAGVFTGSFTNGL